MAVLPNTKSLQLFQHIVERAASVSATVVNESSSETLSNIVDRLRNFTNRNSLKPNETRVFGLEDENGRTIKVTVAREDAAEFEQTIQNELANISDDADSSVEIASLLFELKDRFKIIDIDWPELEEDEEVPQRATSGSGDSQDGEQDALDLDDIDVDQSSDSDDNDELNPDGELDNVSKPAGTADLDAKDLLMQVIDLMQADVAARTKEAEARQREAEAREQEIATQQVLARVKQEEQILDMEQDMKTQKEQDREVKQLAQLAKWKSDNARKQGLNPEEEEEKLLPKMPPAPVIKKPSPGVHRERARKILGKI